MNKGDLVLFGPKSDGVVAQLWSCGWRLYSKRFGLLGAAFQGDSRILNSARKKAHKQGHALKRRWEGKNGWLWNYLYRKEQELENLQNDVVDNYIRVPSATWYWKIVMRLLFGYKYPRAWREDEEAE